MRTAAQSRTSFARSSAAKCADFSAGTGTVGGGGGGGFAAKSVTFAERSFTCLSSSFT